MSATRRLTLWGAPVAALFLTFPAFADEPGELLERMVKASHEQSYQGAFVYERTGSFSTHYVWRQQEGEQMVERLLQTDGDPQEWLRHNGELVCTSSIALRAAWNDTGHVSEQLALLHNWYSLQVLGATRVADRPVSVLAVKPRDPYRYAYELYLDQETGLLLKSLLINDRSILLERFQFASLEIGPVAAADLEPGAVCLPLDTQTVGAAERADDLAPAWLPPGFVLGHSEERALNGGSSEVVTQVYTDGLARFTLFIEPLSTDTLAEDLRAQLGPTVAISRKLVRADGEYLATVVGEIPATAAERVADSLSAENAEDGQP